MKRDLKKAEDMPQSTEKEECSDLSVIGKDLEHEIENKMSTLKTYRMYSGEEGMHFTGIKGNEEELDNFLRDAEHMVEKAKSHNCIEEYEVEQLVEDYKGRFEGKTEQLVDFVVSVCRDVYEYQRRVEEEPARDTIKLSELLEPAEKTSLRLSELDSDIEPVAEYNGLEESEIQGDHGLRIMVSTIAKNWEDHAYNPTGVKAEKLGFHVEEKPESYIINLFDDGEGFFNLAGNEEGREKLFNSIVRAENNCRGISMLDRVSDTYNISFSYSEDALEDIDSSTGFGVQIEAYKP